MLLHHGTSREMRKEQVYAGKLAQPFTPDINVESGGVNYGITAAVRNVRSNHCGVSGGFSRLTVAPWGLIHPRRRMKWDAEGV